jgi:heme oxygenase
MSPLPDLAIPAESRALRLRVMTRETHERLDHRVMNAASFATRDGYARFAASQSLFHRDIDALYADPALRAVLSNLALRRQLPLLALDLADLGAPVPPGESPPVFAADKPIDLPTALGWLYVAEGSRMGAALLRREAAKLGLSDGFGARHLAPAPEGPAAHWRAFVAALDAVDLAPEHEARVITGATAAFAQVQAHVDQRLG